MKTHKPTIILALCALLAFSPGCSLLVPKPGVTYNAARFNSFKVTWVSTLAVYDYQMDLRVQGKISPEDAEVIDAAWNSFRLGYKVALAQARGDDTAFTPDNVRKLADDVLTLIYAAQ